MLPDAYRHIYRDSDGEIRYHRVTLADGKMHVRGTVRPDGELLIAWRRHDDDRVVMAGSAGGVVVLERPCMGFFAFAWGPGDLLVVQHDTSGIFSVYKPTGEFVTRVTGTYAAEGISHIEDEDWRVVMMNDSSRTRVMPNGETWVNCEETEHYIAGQFGRDPDFGQSLSLYDKRTGQIRRWLGSTVLPFTMVEDDNLQPLLALNGNTPEPDEIDWVADFPPLPVTLPPVVAQPESPRPMLRGGFGDVIPGSNVGGSGHPLNVIDGPDYIKPYDEPKLRGVIFDPFYTHDQAQIERDRQKCIEIAKRTGAPVCVYDDGHPIGHLLGALRAEGVATMTLTQAYPGPDLLDRLEDARLLRDVIVRALYHADQWTDYELAESYRLIDEWLERTDGLFKLKGDLAAGWNRGAPQSPKPWQREYFQARCERTPEYDWADWPRTITAPRGRPPEKPSQPIVTTGKTHPPRADTIGAWARLIRAVARLFRRAA